MDRRKGFSIHEVLVVLATVGILGVVAVPQYQEARTRQKIAQVRSDFQEIAIAIDAYFVDWEYYPLDGYRSSNIVGRLQDSLTTPVAYLTSIPKEPFPNLLIVPDWYAYWNYQRYLEDSPDNYQSIVNGFTSGGFSFVGYGVWRLNSIGPDGMFGPQDVMLSMRSPISKLYDPTNGIHSTSDIIRTQKFEEMKTNYVQ